MGFWDGVKAKSEEYTQQRREAEREAKRKANKPYKPFQRPYNGAMGTSDYEQFLEQNAPHLIETIYHIRDRVDKFPADTSQSIITEEEYKVLQARYNELERHYENLQKQHSDLIEAMKNLPKER